MISAIIYLAIMCLNILAFNKIKGKNRWFNLVVVVFMAGISFIIKWNELP